MTVNQVLGQVEQTILDLMVNLGPAANDPDPLKKARVEGALDGLSQVRARIKPLVDEQKRISHAKMAAKRAVGSDPAQGDVSASRRRKSA